MNNKIDKIKKYVEDKLKLEATGHDYFHSLRVMNNAISISQGLNVDLEVIKVACLTHDLIDKKVSKNIDLSIKELTEKLSIVGYEDKMISIVMDIIENVSYSKGNIPKSIEGKIVQDADRLDALGAVGIARTFAYGGNNNRLIYNPGTSDNSDSIYHFYDKLFNLADLMNTDNARLIALKRTKLMKEFLNNFYKEWDGKDLE